MASTRKQRQRQRKNKVQTRGGGVGTSQQWFDPDVLPPSTLFAGTSTAPTSTEIRPVLQSTFSSGGARKARKGSSRKGTRKHRGGFSPNIMGAFVANAQAAIVPLSLYLVYQAFVPKKKDSKNSKKNSKNSRTKRSR